MAFKTWQKYTLAIVPVIIVSAILIYFGDIVSYIVMAWVVSMIGAPVFRFLDRYMGDGLAAGLTLFLFTLVLFLLIRLFVPPLVNQAKNLAGIDYEKILTGLEEPIGDTKTWLISKGIIHEDVITNLEKEPETNEPQIKIIQVDSLLRAKGDTSATTGINLLINIDQHWDRTPIIETETGYFEGLRSNIFEMFNPSQIPKLISSLVGFFGGLVVTTMSVFFIAFFFLREKGLFKKMVSFLVPNNKESKVQHAIDESSIMLVRYFVGLVVQVIVITIITTIVLKLLGFQNALLMAFCFAVFNLIPYLGPLLGNFVGVLIVISSNLEVSFYDVMLPKIITAVVVFTVLQMLDNFLLQPNIFSKSVKAHPLEIFLVVLMGAKIGGVAGMVLAIPGYTVLRVLLKVFFSEFEVVQKLTSSLDQEDEIQEQAEPVPE